MFGCTAQHEAHPHVRRFAEISLKERFRLFRGQRWSLSTHLLASRANPTSKMIAVPPNTMVQSVLGLMIRSLSSRCGSGVIPEA